ncbi:MAG: cytochrome c [Rhodobacteraceae bacterium]|nr:cytochrome c [Paracoccaceae bacterium]
MNIKVLGGVGLVVIAVAYSIFKPVGDRAEAPLVQGASMVAVALPAALSEQAQIGKRGFDAKCAQCHGANAAGQNGVAPSLIHKIYEPNHHSDAAFLVAAKNGVRAHHWRFGNMPPVPGLTDADVLNITRYIREVQKENGIF